MGGNWHHGMLLNWYNNIEPARGCTCAVPNVITQPHLVVYQIKLLVKTLY